MRFVFVRMGCPFCEVAEEAVEVINKKLEEEARIRIIDNYAFELFGINENPIISRINKKTFDSYPFIYIDGVVVKPAPKELLIITIAKILEDELLEEIRVGDISISN